MLHLPNNKYCYACMRGKAQSKPYRATEAWQRFKTEPFAAYATGDHTIANNAVSQG